MRPTARTSALIGSAALIALCGIAGAARAHCDTLDGPVVQDARLALEKKDATAVLKWVRAEDEREVRDAFAQAVKVRALGEEARQLADMYFFETLVRIHRAAEGAPYTGLRPAGAVEPAVAAADKALEAGNIGPLADHVAEAVREAVVRRFQEAAEKKKHAGESVKAGREYVHAYVAFVHLVENIHLAAAGAAEHGQDAGHAH